MPEEQSGTSGLRFRLPKVFSDSSQDSKNKTEVAQSAPRGTAPVSRAFNAPMQANQSGMATSHNSPGPGPITPTILSQQITSQSGQILEEVVALRGDIELLQQAFVELSDRESNQEKVFNVLHKELSDYKNDFIYEHLKPIIRPLLFLYDSLEQFEEEVGAFERPDVEERRQALSPSLVRDNVTHFRDQLVEALQVCEVTLMDRPEGPFDPKFHKAVDVVAVPPEQDNTIQRVVRSGWFLRGHLFRPAEVVVGRSQAR